MFNKKILILSPHMDDEVLGCGGLIASLMENNPKNLHIHYFNDFHPVVDNEAYKAENAKLISHIGCTSSFTKSKSVNKLNSIPISEHISEIESLANEFQPDTILVTFPSYNQDHRHIFDATITATRVHDRNYYVHNILVYEQPETLQTNRIEPKFLPHVFLPVDVDKKIELYSMYQTQLRGHRRVEHIKYLAGVRGMQCNAPFAESFMIIRSTVKMKSD